MIKRVEKEFKYLIKSPNLSYTFLIRLNLEKQNIKRDIVLLMMDDSLRK